LASNYKDHLVNAQIASTLNIHILDSKAGNNGVSAYNRRALKNILRLSLLARQYNWVNNCKSGPSNSILTNH
jgi:hypothetical protein